MTQPPERPISDEYVQLDVAAGSLEAFVICLALGTLREMRSGNLRYEAGIWTLGRPVFSRAPEIQSLVSEETLAVIRATDELDAMAEAAGVEKANAWLDEMISTLEGRLRSLGEPKWYAAWRHPNRRHDQAPESAGNP